MFKLEIYLQTYCLKPFSCRKYTYRHNIYARRDGNSNRTRCDILLIENLPLDFLHQHNFKSYQIDISVMTFIYSCVKTVSVLNVTYTLCCTVEKPHTCTAIGFNYEPKSD